MGFNVNPGVQDRSGELIAQGIREFFGQMAERRRSDREDKRRDQSRADARTMTEVQNPGLHLTERGVFDIPQSVWDNTAKSASDAVDRGAGTPSPASAGGIPASSDRSDFQALLAQAMGPRPSTGQRYEFGNGFYRDNAETDTAAQRTQARSGNADFQKVMMHVLENGLTPHNPLVGSPEWKAAEKYKSDLNPRAPVFGTPEWNNAEIKKAQIGAVFGYHPPHDEPIVQVQGPDGEPIWQTRSQAIGQKAKVTTKVESATNTASKARLEAAVSEMNNAHAGMAEFEQGLKSGKYTINGLEQLGGRVANSFTHDDPISMTIQSTALASLNRTNPDLARYIRRGLSFAEGESMISQRPSDFRTKMAAFLSTASSGAHPEMINDIESRRTSILNPLNATVGKTRPAPPTTTGANDKGGDINLKPGEPSHAQQLWDAAVVKHGHDKVLKEFGPRPSQ